MGLILFTNNGDLANDFIHQKNRILRKYEVHSNRQIERDNIKAIKKGIIINNVAYQADISIIAKIKNPESFFDKRFDKLLSLKIRIGLPEIYDSDCFINFEAFSYFCSLNLDNCVK